MLILPLLTVAISGWPFGYASAPYDIRWAARHPKRAAWMALAGPGANILLILLALVSIRIGVAGGVFQSPDSVVFDRITAATAGGIWPGIAFFLSVVFSLNLVLALLNLLPLPPLDGSGAIPLFLNESQTVRYQQFLWGNPALGWIGILVAWQLFDVVWQPIFLFAVNLVYPGVTYG
jgi:Zn-dependent protease